MSKYLTTAAAAMLCGLTFAGGATAADLIIDTPIVEGAAASDWGFYAEIYGGARLANGSTYDGDPYDMDPTWAVGAALGLETPVPGLSFELDVMQTGEAGYVVEPCCALSSLSVMINGEYALPVGDTFALYGALGVGGINVSFVDPGGTESTWAAGYQAAIGVRANVMDNVAVFAELKHQDTFAPVFLDGNDITAPTNSALVGLRFSMN